MLTSAWLTCRNVTLSGAFPDPLEHDADAIISKFYESKTPDDFVYSVFHAGSHAWSRLLGIRYLLKK